MNRLLFNMGNFGRNYIMAPEGGAGGDGGGSVGAGVAGGGEGGSGGQDGQGGQGGQGGAGGALSGAGGQGGQGGQGGADTIDYAKITDADYMAKVKVPQIEGVQLNVEDVGKRYAAFCRENKIPPEVMSKFLELEGKYFAEDDKKAADEMQRVANEKKANFDAQGELLKKTYTQEQIGTAVKVLETDEFSGDKDFMAIATKELSNNPTLVKLLLNWSEHHQADTGTGAGQGTGAGGTVGFAERWTGKKL